MSVTKKKKRNKSRGEIIQRLAKAILDETNFAQNQGGQLYRYHAGVYREGADEHVRQQVDRLLDKWNEKSNWSMRIAAEVAELIRVRSPVLWEKPPTDVVNVQNGLLNVRTRELREHSPEHLSPIQLPVNYDPHAECPKVDKFFREVFPSDAIAVAYELVGWLIVPLMSLQVAVLLLGSGANGKSTFLGLLSRLLNQRNVSTVSLHKLESNRFASAKLVGKLANICPDLPTQHLAETSMFKAIVGEDAVSAEYKHGKLFEFFCYARLLFSANEPPRSSDNSDGFYRRWTVLPFDAQITNPRPKAELEAELTAPSELSGLLNKGLDGLDQLRLTNKFSDSESMRQALAEFRAATDPLAVWLDRNTIDDPNGYVLAKQLRLAYGADCERRGKNPMTDRAFKPALTRLRPGVSRGQRTINGVKGQWCYVGIRLAEDDATPQSPHTPDYFT